MALAVAVTMMTVTEVVTVASLWLVAVTLTVAVILTVAVPSPGALRQAFNMVEHERLHGLFCTCNEAVMPLQLQQ